MSEEYELHRRRQLDEARDAFNAFVGKLTPAQRAKLGKVGKPADDTEMVNGHTVDVVELPSASYRTDLAAEIDTFGETIAERFGLGLEAAYLLAEWMANEIAQRAMNYRAQDLNRISGVFIDSKNPKLFSAGLAFAANIASINGLGTQAEFARQLGLSRAAVSKATKFWQSFLNLPPSPHMKSAKACEKYRKKAREDHWRRRKLDRSEQSTKTLQKLNKQFAL
jgi:hypothetical protein